MTINIILFIATFITILYVGVLLAVNVDELKKRVRIIEEKMDMTGKEQGHER